MSRFSRLVLSAMLCVILLAAAWGSYVLYSNWTEKKKVDNLAQECGSDLLEAVERYRVGLAISGYKGRDELDQFATGSALRLLQLYWDRMQKGERIITLTSLDYSSTQVLSCEEKEAELMISVRWREVIDGPMDMEFTEQRLLGGWVRYTLQLENDTWKVSDLNACPAQDQSCINKLKND